MTGTKRLLEEIQIEDIERTDLNTGNLHQLLMQNHVINYNSYI